MKNKTTNTQGQRELKTERKANVIKLGIDVHADSYRVVRQIDGATPQPAQKFSPEKFLEWAVKQKQLAEKVYSCYEAGPFGYGLDRALKAKGIINVVVRPQNWDELGKGVKTDKTDALALVQRLDRYVGGNKKAFAAITVPTEEQQMDRALSRQREQLLEHRKSMEAQGRSLLLFNGIRVRGRWWSPRSWEKLAPQISSQIRSLLAIHQELITKINEKVEEVTEGLVKQAKPQPFGLGAFTGEVLRREIKDWKHFGNRRQIGSMGGLCPGVRASGNKSFNGSIIKHGNPRLRRVLIEAVWRLQRFQPEYPPISKWRKVFSNPLATSAAKKKAVVAIGRRLLIDLWRINTGRATANDLGLKMAA